MVAPSSNIRFWSILPPRTLKPLYPSEVACTPGVSCTAFNGSISPNSAGRVLISCAVSLSAPVSVVSVLVVWAETVAASICSAISFRDTSISQSLSNSMFLCSSEYPRWDMVMTYAAGGRAIANFPILSVAVPVPAGDTTIDALCRYSPVDADLTLPDNMYFLLSAQKHAEGSSIMKIYKIPIRCMSGGEYICRRGRELYKYSLNSCLLQ